MANYGLDEILVLIKQWEQRLDAFYMMMEDYLVSARSRKAATILQERQKKTLAFLDQIHVKDYARTEFIKNIPDSHSEDLIPHLEIAADSTPNEVFQLILGYEEQLEDYYIHLRDILVYAKSKELLDMLIQFKVGQIKEIKGLMDDADLAV